MGRIRTRWLVALTAVLTVLVVLIPVLWATRSAQASGVTITLSPVVGPPGTTAQVAGSGFRHKESVTITFNAVVVATATTTVTGTFSASFTVAQATQPGNYTVVATGERKDTASATFQVVSGAYNWPQFSFAPQGGRFNPAETTLSPSTANQLTQDWSASLHGTISSFAVYDGAVYTDDGTGVSAFDVTTGKQLWYSSTMGGGYTVSSDTSPAVDSGIVYVGGSDRNFYAFDAQTGATRWTFNTNSYLLSSPTVVNGVVYITVKNGAIYALNGATGAVIWSAHTTSPADSINQTPAVVNGAVYFVSQLGVAYALDASTGALLWSNTVGSIGPVVSAPVVDNGVVYTTVGAAYPSTQGEVIALDAQTGATKWVAYTAYLNVYGPALANGTLFASSPTGGVYAFDEATGALKWQVSEAIDTSAPAVANGVVYVGAGSSTVMAFDAATGATLAALGNCTPSSTSPVVAQGVVYAGCGSSLTAYHLPGMTP